MGKLDGKIALVTGGNSGLGLATAGLFVAEGAMVYITGRRQAELDAAVKSIGRNVTAVRADSSNLDDLDGMFAAGLYAEYDGQQRRLGGVASSGATA
jgi:NAD(P)-dependent dehydrogenase (short-subunit alcohol dehydrogenase family)